MALVLTAGVVAVAAALLLARGPLPVRTVVSPNAAAATAPPAQPRPDWTQYVMAPSSRDLRPVAVLSVEPGTGAVTSPERLTDAGAPPLRLEAAGGNGPVLVLDFGKVVSGKPEITVLATSGPPPTIQLSFAEARLYLTPGSDTQDYGTGDLTYRPETPGRWTAPARRSFRYLRVALTSPGWVELDGIGLYFTAYQGTADNLRGHFQSSDGLLDRIWYAGAYTLDLVTAPGSGSICDGNWELVRARLHAWDCGARREMLDVQTFVPPDAVVEFTVEIVPGGAAAGWLLRATPGRGYLMELVAGAPGVLRRTLRDPAGDTRLPDVPLPFAVEHGRAYPVVAATRGQNITVTVNGHRVEAFASGGPPDGHLGFFAGPGSHFFVGPVTLRDAAGKALAGDDFSGRNPPVPDCARWNPQGFAPRQWAPLCGPALLDGAKRDRAVAAADVAIAARTAYATSYHTEAVRSSLQHLAYAMLPPPTALAEFPMWWVIALRDYHFATADTEFVQRVLPRVPEILDHALGLRDRRGLVVHEAGCDHIDWYWSVCGRGGAVTSVNALTVGGLEAGAELLAAFGNAEAAGRYRAEAASLRRVMAPLWDGTANAWADSDTDAAHHPLDGNTLPVVFGVQPERDRAALDWVRGRLWTPWGSRTAEAPYGVDARRHNLTIWTVYGYYEVLARFQTGDDAGALDVIRRAWGNMLARDPNSTFWEWADAEGGPPEGFTSLTHGWSTGAVDALTGYVLGVRSTAPGFRQWAVRPHPGDVAWAQGRVPTPDGAIDAAWQQDAAAGAMRIEVAAPDGTAGTVAVPKLGRAQTAVWLNGVPVWDGTEAAAHPGGVQARDEGTYVVLAGVPGGRQVVTSAGTP